MPRRNDPEPLGEQLEPWPLRREPLARVQEQQRPVLATFDELQGRACQRDCCVHPGASPVVGPGVNFGDNRRAMPRLLGGLQPRMASRCRKRRSATSALGAGRVPIAVGFSYLKSDGLTTGGENALADSGS